MECPIIFVLLQDQLPKSVRRFKTNLSSVLLTNLANLPRDNPSYLVQTDLHDGDLQIECYKLSHRKKQGRVWKLFKHLCEHKV